MIYNQNLLVLYNDEDVSAKSLFDNQYDPNADENGSDNNSNQNLTVPNEKKQGSDESD
jgi:hypothetical protein